MAEEKNELWLLAGFVFGVLGGILSYLYLKERDHGLARRCLYAGMVFTAVWLFIGITAIDAFSEKAEDKIFKWMKKMHMWGSDYRGGWHEETYPSHGSPEGGWDRSESFGNDPDGWYEFHGGEIEPCPAKNGAPSMLCGDRAMHGEYDRPDDPVPDGWMKTCGSDWHPGSKGVQIPEHWLRACAEKGMEPLPYMGRH